jgi:uncharacterized protein (TIGR00290 family)
MKQLNINDIKGKRFVASYSGGKDSHLSLYKALKAGAVCVGLITSYNEEVARSHIHGINKEILEKISKSLEIPINIVVTNGYDYALDLEKALARAKDQGAEFAVFGDIDIIDHFNWDAERCTNVGLDYYFPLYMEKRIDIVKEIINAGIKTKITVINKDVMPEQFIGQTLTKQLVKELEDNDVDPCGENGEYHSFVYESPLYKRSLDIKFGQPTDYNNLKVLPIELDK